MNTLTVPADYLPGFLTEPEADALFTTLRDGLPWTQKQITMYGKTTDVPRLICWVGHVDYTFSGFNNAGQPWTPELEALRLRLEIAAGATFNSCLANLYRDGQDTVGWHSDDEVGLGQTPTIASLSLGAGRTFKMRHEATREVVDFELGHGDLVVMRDESQADLRHSVPRRARVNEPRINLTFRQFD